jgi:hypothetical protein
LGLGLEDRVEQSRGVAEKSCVVFGVAQLLGSFVGEKAEERERFSVGLGMAGLLARLLERMQRRTTVGLRVLRRRAATTTIGAWQSNPRPLMIT